MAKIAFVGTAGSRTNAPYTDPEWEIWAQAVAVPKWDRWFELHDLDSLPPTYDALRAMLFASDGSKPIYMQAPDKRIKGSVAYPLERVKKVYGKFGAEFLSSTCSLALALALEEALERIAAGGKPEDEVIGLWGIEMSDDDEYAAQKPGARAFLTMIERFGIKVVLPSGCELISSSCIYALEATPLVDKVEHQREIWHKKRALLDSQRQNIEVQMSDMRRQLERIQNEQVYAEGALGNLDYAERNWVK